MRVHYCYDCGQACSDALGVPICPTCGPRWKLVRSAPAAEVLIVRGDEVLLVRRANDPYRGRWEIPGGFADRGEHPSDTARREVDEELGLTVELVALLGFYFDAYFDDVVQVVSFVGRVEGDPTPDPSEVAEVRWFDSTNLPGEHDVVPGHLDRLRHWRRLRDGIAGPVLGGVPPKESRAVE